MKFSRTREIMGRANVEDTGMDLYLASMKKKYLGTISVITESWCMTDTWQSDDFIIRRSDSFIAGGGMVDQVSISTLKVVPIVDGVYFCCALDGTSAFVINQLMDWCADHEKSGLKLLHGLVMRRARILSKMLGPDKAADLLDFNRCKIELKRVQKEHPDVF